MNEYICKNKIKVIFGLSAIGVSAALLSIYSKKLRSKLIPEKKFVILTDYPHR